MSSSVASASRLKGALMLGSGGPLLPGERLWPFSGLRLKRLLPEECRDMALGGWERKGRELG